MIGWRFRKPVEIYARCLGGQQLFSCFGYFFFKKLSSENVFNSKVEYFDFKFVFLKTNID